jgi:hypothetical protein
MPPSTSDWTPLRNDLSAPLILSQSFVSPVSGSTAESVRSAGDRTTHGPVEAGPTHLSLPGPWVRPSSASTVPSIEAVPLAMFVGGGLSAPLGHLAPRGSDFLRKGGEACLPDGAVRTATPRAASSETPVPVVVAPPGSASSALRPSMSALSKRLEFDAGRGSTPGPRAPRVGDPPLITPVRGGASVVPGSASVHPGPVGSSRALLNPSALPGYLSSMSKRTPSGVARHSCAARLDAIKAGLRSISAANAKDFRMLLSSRCVPHSFFVSHHRCVTHFVSSTLVVGTRGCEDCFHCSSKAGSYPCMPWLWPPPTLPVGLRSVDYLRSELAAVSSAGNLLSPTDIEEYNALCDLYNRRKRQRVELDLASTTS